MCSCRLDRLDGDVILTLERQYEREVVLTLDLTPACCQSQIANVEQLEPDILRP